MVTRQTDRYLPSRSSMPRSSQRRTMRKRREVRSWPRPDPLMVENTVAKGGHMHHHWTVPLCLRFELVLGVQARYKAKRWTSSLPPDIAHWVSLDWLYRILLAEWLSVGAFRSVPPPTKVIIQKVLLRIWIGKSTLMNCLYRTLWPT